MMCHSVIYLVCILLGSLELLGSEINYFHKIRDYWCQYIFRYFYAPLFLSSFLRLQINTHCTLILFCRSLRTCSFFFVFYSVCSADQIILTDLSLHLLTISSAFLSCSWAHPMNFLFVYLLSSSKISILKI